MASDEEIHSALVGDSGRDVSRLLLLGLKSLTRWPVDAFFVDDLGDDGEMVGWVQGNVVGLVRTDGRGDEGHVRGDLHHLSQVKAVRVDVNVFDDPSSMRARMHRAITLEFSDGEELSIDVGSFSNLHFRSRADDFVSTVIIRLHQLQGAS